MLRASYDIRAVLFDLDGVLINSYDAWFHQFQQALRHFGHSPVSEHEFRKHWGQSTEDDVRIFMSERTVGEVKQYFYDHYDEYVQYLSMEPDADRVLHLIKELKLRIGCVTNSHGPIVKETLRHFRLYPYFETVVTADDVRTPKPSPAMILHACQDLKTRPERTVFLGDTATDAAAALSAGCMFVGYRINGEIRVDCLREFAVWLEDVIDMKNQQ